MKGVSSVAIIALASLIIAALFVFTGYKASSDALTDKYPITLLAAYSIRNSMITISTTELGVRYYTAPEGFKVSVDEKFVNVTALTGMKKPTIVLPHYAGDVIKTTAPLNDTSFCIVKKLDENCLPVVEVCPANNTACCSIDINGCLSGDAMMPGGVYGSGATTLPGDPLLTESAYFFNTKEICALTVTGMPASVPTYYSPITNVKNATKCDTKLEIGIPSIYDTHFRIFLLDDSQYYLYYDYSDKDGNKVDGSEYLSEGGNYIADIVCGNDPFASPSKYKMSIDLKNVSADAGCKKFEFDLRFKEVN